MGRRPGGRGGEFWGRKCQETTHGIQMRGTGPGRLERAGRRHNEREQEPGVGGHTGTERRDQRDRAEARRPRKDGETLGTKGERGDSAGQKEAGVRQKWGGQVPRGQSPPPTSGPGASLVPPPHTRHTGPQGPQSTRSSWVSVGKSWPPQPHPLLDSCPPNALGPPWPCRVLGRGPLTAVLTHLLTHKAPNVVLLGAPGTQGRECGGTASSQGPEPGVRGQGSGVRMLVRGQGPAHPATLTVSAASPFSPRGPAGPGRPYVQRGPGCDL